MSFSAKGLICSRIWQNINVVSGENYRLTFKITGPKEGAFVILRNIKTGKEKYKWCNGANEDKEYIWDISPVANENRQVYFATNKKGNYYFHNISFRQNNNRLIPLYRVIAFSMLIISIMILFRFNFGFALIITFLSVLPLAKINLETKAEKENRNLSTFKSIIKNGQINLKFGSDFNEWLNDRFYGRTFFISLFRDIRCFCDRRVENQNALQGKDGWLFQKLKQNNFYYSSIVDNLLQLQAQCNSLGIQVFFGSIPEKNSIYSEYNYYNTMKEQLPENLSQRKDFNFLFLFEEFTKEKENGLLYFKDDHHWTGHGAYIYCKKFIECCKKHSTELKELDLGDYRVTIVTNSYNNSLKSPDFLEIKNYEGSITRLLNLEGYSKKNISVYEIYRNKKIPIPGAELFKEKFKYSKFVNPNVDNNVKVMIIGDSNIPFMIPFITSTFKQSLFLQTTTSGNFGWYLKNYSKLVEKFKPDYMLIIVRSTNLYKWKEITTF